MRLSNTYQDEQELKNLNKSITFHKKISVILEKMFVLSKRQRENYVFDLFAFFSQFFSRFLAELFFSYKRVTLQQFIKRKILKKYCVKKNLATKPLL